MSLSDIWVIFSVLYYRDIYCGKLVCLWTRTEVVPFKNFDTQYTFLGGIVCLSAHLRNSTPITFRDDYTYVESGTMCGPNQVNTNSS